MVGQSKVKSNGHYPKRRGKGSANSGPSGHRGQKDLVERSTNGEAVESWRCVEGCPVGMFPEAKSRGRYMDSLDDDPTSKQLFGTHRGSNSRDNTYAGETGSAARFFYCAKAATRERWFLCKTCSSVHPAKERERRLLGEMLGSAPLSHIWRAWRFRFARFLGLPHGPGLDPGVPAWPFFAHVLASLGLCGLWLGVRVWRRLRLGAVGYHSGGERIPAGVWVVAIALAWSTTYAFFSMVPVRYITQGFAFWAVAPYLLAHDIPKGETQCQRSPSDK